MKKIALSLMTLGLLQSTAALATAPTAGAGGRLPNTTARSALP